MTHDETRTRNNGRTGNDPADQTVPTYSAERVRQGRIILNTPLRRAVFIGGLIAFVLLALIAAAVW